MANEERKVKRVPINSLKLAEHNPGRRITNGGRLNALKCSIEEHGLQYPILVTPDMEVVDGHRRLAACKALGWEEIEIIVTVSDKNKIYAEVNATAMRLQGNDVLHIFLKNKDALTPIQRNRCQRAQEELGMRLLRKIHQGGNSLQAYSMAKKAQGYCDQKNQKFLHQAVEWILENGVHQLRMAMDTNTSAGVIVRAIKENRPLKPSYVEQE